MSYNVPYPPNLTGKTDKEKIALLTSYLWQMAEQLNWALEQLGVEQGKNDSVGISG